MKSYNAETLERGFFKTSQGWCAAAWTDKGLSALGKPKKHKSAAFKILNDNLPPLPVAFWDNPPIQVPDWIKSTTQKALVGKKFAPVPLDLFFMTEFQKKVLLATASIPWGQTRSYGWAAQKAGARRGARAAGSALNHNPAGILIPCHRVIGSQNRLGGYGGESLDWKVKLLKLEKVKILRLADGSYKVL